MATRLRHAQLSFAQIVLFGVALPSAETLMDPQMKRIDELLSDEELLETVFAQMRTRSPNSAHRGRSSTPSEVVLRLLALKHLKRWSYDQLEWEVTGNFVYRRFCRIHEKRVPDAKTMVRWGQVLDGPALASVFARVVAVAINRGVARGRKMRIDSTVVDAPIHRPADSTLCEDVVRVLGRSLRKLVGAGVKLSFAVKSVRVSVSRRMREIGQALRKGGDDRTQALKRSYAKLLRITGRFVRHSRKAIAEAPSQFRNLSKARRSRAKRALDLMKMMVPRAEQVVRQARARVFKGITNSKGKLLSLFEPYAQIFQKAKFRSPDFGVMVRVQEAEAGVVTDIGLVDGHNDAPLLIPAVEKHKALFRKAPKLVATDRGFYSGEGERRIKELGVVHAVVPKPGFRSPDRIRFERQRWFRRGRAWRAGGEARISRLKHGFGMARGRYRGRDGMARTVYWAAIANNLTAIATKMR